MTAPRCRQAHEYWESFEKGELDESKRALILEHLEECPDCKRAYEYRAGLVDLAAGAQIDPILKRRIEVAVRSKLSAPSAGSPRVSGIYRVALPLAAAAAIALGFVYWRASSSEPESKTPAARVAPGRAPDPGHIQRDVAVEMVSTADDEQTISVYSNTALWLAKDTSVEVVEKSQDLAHFALKRGRVVAKIGDHRPGLRFIVSTPLAEIEAHGTLFSVEVGRDGEEIARVVEGVVEVRLRSGETRFDLRAGQEIALKEPSPRPAEERDLSDDRCSVEKDGCEGRGGNRSRPARVAASPSSERSNEEVDSEDIEKQISEAMKNGALERAEGMLLGAQAGSLAENDRIDLMVRLARRYRQGGMYGPAANVYQKLHALYPHSPTAVNGLVALAQMEQDELKDPALALKHFNLYLARSPGGPLAEAAHAGKVRALFQLGDFARTVQAADEYLARYKGSFSSAEIERKRASASERLGTDLAPANHQ